MSHPRKVMLTIHKTAAGVGYFYPGWDNPDLTIGQVIIKDYPTGLTRYAWIDGDGRALRVDWLRRFTYPWAGPRGTYPPRGE